MAISQCLWCNCLKFQEGPQNGAGPAAIHRRRGGGSHQDAQLPAVGVQPPQGVLLQVQHLNATSIAASSEYHTMWPSRPRTRRTVRSGRDTRINSI